MSDAKNWRLREPIPEAAEQELRAYPELLRRLLFYRGVKTAEEADRFLQPSYERDIHDPFLMKDMERAVERLLQAFQTGEKIVVFADYDADGVPGAAVLTEFFRAVSFTNFEVYIPNRHEEAYGLSPETVKSFAQNGARLILTIDCGITDVEEIALANSLGLQVIITDHHLPPPDGGLPPAYAILNPKQPGDAYPEKMLCGAAVVFKLVQALRRSPNFRGFTRLLTGSDADKNSGSAAVSNWEKWLLDLVALATLSDLVPLKGENRALAYFGLQVLQRTRRAGLQALMASAKINRRFVAADDIVYLLGPRINAASRMTHATDAYYLLTTSDLAEAETLARHLEKKNAERRTLAETVLSSAQTAEAKTSAASLLVLGDASWPLGILGLTANRLMESFRRPVFLWSKNGSGEIKGSCRSDGSVNLVELMSSAGGRDFFSDFGGHAAAGGFSLAAGRISELAPRLIQAYAAVPKSEVKPDVLIDAEFDIDEVAPSLLETVESLNPCGKGNPKPLFLFRRAAVAAARTFGNGGLHLELSFVRAGEALKAIGFFANSGGRVLPEAGEQLDLLANLEQSHFRGRPELRLRIVDWRSAK